jgi:hypothetical protein
LLPFLIEELIRSEDQRFFYMSKFLLLQVNYPQMPQIGRRPFSCMPMRSPHIWVIVNRRRCFVPGVGSKPLQPCQVEGLGLGAVQDRFGDVRRQKG